MDEEAFLRAVLADPSLSTPRLVYADWLDDQSDPHSARKAAFIRLEARLAETPDRSLNRVRFVRQLQQLAVGLDPDWLAAVSHPALEACRLRFQFECPARWDRLTPTDDTRVRHCGGCDRTVHYCDTIAAARRHAAAGNCVAVSPALVRQPNDLAPPWPIRLSPDMLERLGRVGTAPALTDSSRAAKPDHKRERPLKPLHRKQRAKRVRRDEPDE